MSDTGNDDWDFKVEPPSGDEGPKPEKKKKKKRPQKTLLAEGKPKNLKLDTSSVPQRKSRSRAEDYLGEDSLKNAELPRKDEHITALAIDVVLFLILNAVAQANVDFTFHQLSAILEQTMGSNDILKFALIRYAMHGLNVCVLYFIVMVLPAIFTGKTPGKFFNKTLIEDIDGGHPGGMRILLRETVGKLLAVITLVGVALIFMTKQGRGLHDFIFKTVVRKD